MHACPKAHLKFESPDVEHKQLQEIIVVHFLRQLRDELRVWIVF